jgi:ribonuclease P protein subunit POP4
MTGHLVNHEFIGLHTVVTDSTNKGVVGLSGKIIDETKSMFVLETKSGTKMVPKQHSSWKFESSNEIIDGKTISRRPEDRIKVKV